MTPRRGPGLRFRLAATIVALVALTSLVLGAGASIAVDDAIRGRVVSEATRDAGFDLSVLVPDALGGSDDRAAFETSDLPATLLARGGLGTIVDWGDGNPYASSTDLAGALAEIPAATRAAAEAGGALAYAWTTIAGRPVLVVGGRPAGVPATFWFVRDTADVESTLTTLRIALLVGGVVLVGVALVAARQVARGILRPIAASAAAAERIAAGDLGARVGASGGDELAALGASFDRMAASLESTIERLRGAESQNRRFVADVAHELRTPLAALVAEASVVRDALASGDLGPGERRAAELLVTDVARLRVLVEDLMELSRFDASAEEARGEPIDLGTAVATIAAARDPDARVARPARPVIVRAEPRRLDRILGNLLDNARQHAPGASVEVVVGQEADTAIVTVRDRGPGVPIADLPRLFERFWKGDASRTRGTSGLGLAIAAEHAALLGGSLAAALPPGGGLAVTLRLPVAAPPQVVADSLPAGDGVDTTRPDPRGVPDPRGGPADGRLVR
jgi:signal transduction histidine kinase